LSGRFVVKWKCKEKKAVIPLKVAVAGGTGFIGGHLIRHLLERHDEVVLISRSHAKRSPFGLKTFRWDELPERKAELEGLDAIVNLAGESINQRWTADAKRRILQSRVETATRIAELVAALYNKPGVVVNGSGISAYGTSETETYDETSPPRVVDFLSGVVEKWEQAIDAISDTRVVKLRTGIVLGRDGGALPLMALPYKLGVGGRVGSGRQWMSWIHIEDMVRLIRFVIENESVRGPVNATAPHPVTNDEFGRALARTLRRPHWFPVPAVLIKLALGQMSELLLNGQHVRPRVLLESGFTFLYPTAESALARLYGEKT
jgi:hypothetical protein